MKEYTEYLINNKAAKIRARSNEKKNGLIQQIKEKFGYNAPKCLTIKQLEIILNK